VLDRARSGPEPPAAEPSDSRLGAILGRAGTGSSPLLDRLRALRDRVRRDSGDATDRRLGPLLGAPRHNPGEPAQDRRPGAALGVPSVGRRRLAELGAAVGVVLVALVLVGVTLTVGRSDTAPPGPGLPVPAEELVQTTSSTGPSSVPKPGPGSTASFSPVARIPGRPAQTVPVPIASGATTPAAPPTTRVSVPVPPPTPRPTTASPSPSPTPSPSPSPSESPSPTDTEPPPGAP